MGNLGLRETDASLPPVSRVVIGGDGEEPHVGRMERGSHAEPYTPQAPVGEHAGGSVNWAAPDWGQGAKRLQRKEPRQDSKVLNMALNTLKREA